MENTEEKAIPKVVFSEDCVVKPTIKVPLDFNGNIVEITMEQLSAGKRRSVANKHLKTSLVGSQMQGSMDSMGFQIGVLSNVIIDAPFPTDEKTLGDFPGSVLDYLYAEYNQAFESSDKKKD